MEMDFQWRGLTNRWAFAGLVVILAFLLALKSSIPGTAAIGISLLRYAIGAFWAVGLRFRLSRVGLPHTPWVLILSMLFALLLCVRLPQLLSLEPAYGAGLFLMLHLPLIILRDKKPSPIFSWAQESNHLGFNGEK
jgi:hypothetical protein